MVLVFNIGSASLRWALFDQNLKKIAGESIEYPDFSKLEKLIGSVIRDNSNLIRENSICQQSAAGKTQPRENRPDKSGRVEELAGLGNAAGIYIAHRVVHGGTKFTQPTKITPEVLKELEKLNHLAPLHNPRALKIIKICRQELPEVENYACFDTSFFTKLPDYTRYYAIPLELAQEHKILRYGFHGISHQYTARKAAKKLGKPLEELQLITAHLGSGASITAIEEGQPIDTSMGFTPLEGLMMATRSGSIDPSIPLFLEKQGYSPQEIEETLNKKSGLRGISGFTPDMREILKEVKDGVASSEAAQGAAATVAAPHSPRGEALRGGVPQNVAARPWRARSACRANQQAQKRTLKDANTPASLKKLRAGLALQMYAYQIKKYIGAYTVALGGLDALVLTGAVAEGAPLVRETITHGLNTVLGDFKVLTISTNEELAIAQKIEKMEE